ncbi:MAG: hypothetical protein V4696_10420 [Pseudomonadota bacterium]
MIKQYAYLAVGAVAVLGLAVAALAALLTSDAARAWWAAGMPL